MARACLALALCLAAARSAPADEPAVVDDFQDVSGWTAVASEGARVWIVPEEGRTGSAMRVGFDLNSAGGYVLVRKAFPLGLPPNFAFTFDLRGEAHPNNFEFKLIDGSGKTVWWRRFRNYAFPGEWQRVTVPKSRIEFAWGAGGGRDLDRISAIELAVSVGEGGGGYFVIDDLRLEPREVAAADGRPPEATATTALPGHEPARALDGDPASAWRSAPEPAAQQLVLDFGHSREYGGLVVDWDPEDWAVAYAVQVSRDGVEWRTERTVTAGNGGRDYVYLPDAESRWVRLDLARSSRGRGYAIRDIEVKPIAFSRSPNDFFAAIAADAPRGTYPKYLLGRQTYWTVVGVPGDTKEALLNEEGMLEVDKASFSIEPFLWVDGKLVTWHDVTLTQSLEDGYLPIPSVTWRHGSLALHVTAFASGRADASMLYARYRVEQHGDRSVPVRLWLAVRPFQVNPPWQSLTMSGGTTAIQDLGFDGRVLSVNRHPRVVPLRRPAAFGAATFDEGAITDFLLVGALPRPPQVTDPAGFASGALEYRFDVAPGRPQEVDLAIPFHDPQLAPVLALRAEDAPALVAAEQAAVRRQWEKLLRRVDVSLPGPDAKLVDVLRTTLAYIVIHRDGASLQPGSRNYARAWIRDGAMTATALLQMGFTPEVREFLEWYVGFQGPDGKVPCCIDRRGADPVSEHDSPGQLVYAVATYYRYTRDIGFVADMWPHVVRAVGYIEALRARRMTDEYRTPERQAYFGLLPESISHEGYSAHPVHSYWDDFFALRGLKDAAALAVVMGDTEHAARWAELRDGFRRTLAASIAATAARHGIDYVPASVELGDFDPSSTSIAITHAAEVDLLPPALLGRTYDRYWDDVERRLRGEGGWDGYTPYEVRNVEVLLRLGEKARALALLDALVADQRPRGWNAWGEITWRDPEAPRFIGDMPHTWVGAGYVRSLRSLLVYEDEADERLVLAAGVRPAWLDADGGVSVRRLPTPHGILSYDLRRTDADTVRLRLFGDLTVPPGKILVRSPLDRPLRSVTVNDRSPAVPVAPDAAIVDAFPAEVVLEYVRAGSEVSG